MSCGTLANGLDPNCDGLQRPGGNDKRVWIGQRADITGYTVDNTTHDVETITMAANKLLYKFIGQQLEHVTENQIQKGKNFNSIKQIVNLVLYPFTTLERETMMNLINAEDLVVFVQNMAGQIEVFGLEIAGSTTSYIVGGLNAESGGNSSGATLQDDTSFKIALSGDFRNLPPIFNINTSPSLATNIAYLDALTVA